MLRKRDVVNWYRSPSFCSVRRAKRRFARRLGFFGSCVSGALILLGPLYREVFHSVLSKALGFKSECGPSVYAFEKRFAALWVHVDRPDPAFAKAV